MDLKEKYYYGLVMGSLESHSHAQANGLDKTELPITHFSPIRSLQTDLERSRIFMQIRSDTIAP